jgi:hypothetical protein
MFEITVDGGRLAVDPDDNYWVLPKSITPEFLTAVFQSDAGNDAHIANLFDHLSQADRDRFADACEASPAHQIAFSDAFVQWAIVGGRDGKWDINQFTIGYRRPLGSWLVDEVLVDSISRVWYAVNPHGIWSEREFDFRYGQALQDHIRRYAEERLIVVESVVKAITQPLETKRVTLLSPDGTIAVSMLTGPPSVDVKLWELPPGYQWMADEPAEG